MNRRSAVQDLSDRDWPVFSGGTPPEAVDAALRAAGLGDGLPLAIPTHARLEQMLRWWGDLHPLDATIDLVPPLNGRLTLASVSYNALLAGALPAEQPVLLAASRAALDPRFNLLGVQTSTGAASTALIVHGPLAQSLQFNDGANCLGPGNRANACVGRALRLLLDHVGGARPGQTDMATLGQPAKLGFCFADANVPELTPLHVRRGFDPTLSAVTVVGLSGLFEVLPLEDRPAPECFVVPLALAIGAARLCAGVGRIGPGSETFVVLPPEVWTDLAQAGCSWEALKATLAARSGIDARADVDDIVLLCAGGVGQKMACLQSWGGATRSVTALV